MIKNIIQLSKLKGFLSCVQNTGSWFTTRLFVQITLITIWSHCRAGSLSWDIRVNLLINLHSYRHKTPFARMHLFCQKEMTRKSQSFWVRSPPTWLWSYAKFDTLFGSRSITRPWSSSLKREPHFLTVSLTAMIQLLVFCYIYSILYWEFVHACCLWFIMDDCFSSISTEIKQKWFK